MSKFTLSIHKYRDWSIKVKLLTITILLMICSVFTVSLLSYSQYTRDFEYQSASRTQQILDQLSVNIDTYLDDLFRLAQLPYYNDSFMNILESNGNNSDIIQYERNVMIEDFLRAIMIYPRKDILSVYILSDSLYFSGRYQTSVDTSVNFKDYDWYKQALTTQDPVFIPTHMEQMVTTPKFKVFSVVKQLSSTKSPDKLLGVIKVDANYTGIESICNKVNMGKEGGLIIVDSNKNIIFSNIDSNLKIDLYEMVRNSKKTFINTKIGKKSFLINSANIPRADWTVISVNSIGELNKNALETRNKTFLMALICSIFAIIILFLFTNTFLKPLMEIIQLMKEVKRGNLLVKFPEQRNDEIGYLGSSFNSMVSKINDMFRENTKLVKEIYEAKFLQKEAQINALYSQIRPHFIYNTLNMISLLMQCGRDEKAIDNINKLSSLMRGMAHLDKEINLETEISFLDSYLGIQSSRYEGRLEYFIDIDPSHYSYSIPALIFQPIVENSVIHGCEKRKEKTLIKIYNIETDDSLEFYIEDNANGMTAENLCKLREKVYSLGSRCFESVETPGKRNGIGLVNVNKRIKIRYGEQYGLTIDSILGKGTTVKITLPKEEDRQCINS